MSRVITFSRVFPKYHPKAGEPTLFVEKILQWYWDMHDLPYYSLDEMFRELNDNADTIYPFEETLNMDNKVEHKNHTIRSGNRWKVGDWFSPRVWSGKPYASKQIIIAPDIEVKKTWDFNIENRDIFIDKQIVFDSEAGFIENNKMINAVALNDGLIANDFLEWFKYPKDFSGQIIAWSKSINY